VAVPADKSDALARIDRKADAVEEQLLAIGFFYVRDLEHGVVPHCGERVYYRKPAGEANEIIRRLFSKGIRGSRAMLPQMSSFALCWLFHTPPRGPCSLLRHERANSAS
jgi:hypothetical protein